MERAHSGEPARPVAIVLPSDAPGGPPRIEGRGRLAWAGNSIYAIPNSRRKKKRQRKNPPNPNKRYCPACGRRAGTEDKPMACPVHMKMSVTRASFQGHAGARTRRRRALKRRLGANGDGWRDTYDAHILSPEWARIRQNVIVRDLGRCLACGENGRDVHHIHYRTLGAETGNELVLLCRRCHKQEHKQSPISKREGHWERMIASQHQIRARGTGCLLRDGAGSSTTPEGAGSSSGAPAEPREETCTTSQPASMVNSRGGVESPEKAMPHQARGEEELDPGDAGPLSWGDAACRQSQTRRICRSGRSGMATETPAS